MFHVEVPLQLELGSSVSIESVGMVLVETRARDFEFISEISCLVGAANWKTLIRLMLPPNAAAGLSKLT